MEQALLRMRLNYSSDADLAVKLSPNSRLGASVCANVRRLDVSVDRAND